VANLSFYLKQNTTYDCLLLN